MQHPFSMDRYGSTKRFPLRMICLKRAFLFKAKPTDEEIRRLSEILNVPTQHLVDEMGEHFFPSRGG
jgi:hypothetical protein